MTAAEVPVNPSEGSRLLRATHIWTLCAFAFSQPVFVALTQYFVYLHDLEATWVEIGYVLVVLAVLIPGLWFLLDQLIGASVALTGGRGRNLVLTILMGIVWLSILRPFMIKVPFLADQAIVWLVSLIIAGAASYVSLQLYLRFIWVRRWVTGAAVAIVFFPGMFLYEYGSLKHAIEEAHSTEIERPVPVVIVVFDEFSGVTLMNRDLQIDAMHFPQFARLAGMSTWYRHASTVHNRTDFAVPALLTGQYPTPRRPALESEHPGNLFRVVQSTGAYDMTIFEPVTRMCPKTLWYSKQPKRSHAQKLRLLTRTLALVYPRLILPNDIPVDFPPISKAWFGLPDEVDVRQEIITGLYHSAAFFERADQFQKFRRGLLKSESPQFHFLHIELPHVPWCFLPTGTNYNFDDSRTFEPAGSQGEIGEDWSANPGIIARNEHRYLLQVGYVDRLIGQLLDQLNQSDLLDECLLIVTADHGVSFRPGHSRRVPDAENIADILSVPLFIKLPGQTIGEVSDVNVEAIDVLPTIADVLGVKLVEPIEGISLLQEGRRPRKSLFVDEKGTLMPVEPRIPRLQAAVDRRWNLFGNDSLDDPPLAASTHPTWRGRSTSEFLIEDFPIKSLMIDPPRPEITETKSEFFPCLVSGTLDPRELKSPPDLVLAVNGIIRDSSGLYHRGRGVQAFEFLLPEWLVQPHPCQIELFQFDKTAPASPLRMKLLKRWNLEDLEKD